MNSPTPPPAPTPPSAGSPWTLVVLVFGAVLVSLVIWVPSGSAGVEEDLAVIRRELRGGGVASLEVWSREQRIEGGFRGVAATALGETFESYVATDEILTEVPVP